MGSRASCVSLAHLHSGGHAPHQTDKTPIGRWSISSSLADSFVLRRVSAWVLADKRSRAIPFTFRQNCPGNPRHLIGHGNRSNVHMCALFQTVSPSRYGRCSIPHKVQYSTRTIDEQLGQITIAVLRDTAQLRLATCRHLARNEAEPCGEIAPLGKTAAGANSGHQGAGMVSQIPGISISRSISWSALTSALISA